MIYKEYDICQVYFYPYDDGNSSMCCCFICFWLSAFHSQIVINMFNKCASATKV